MAVVEDYMIGNTRIIICDDAYKGKTQEEIDEIIRQVSLIGRQYFLSQAQKEGEG